MNDASSSPESELKCPACGDVLGSDAPLGLCPKCLMREALGDGEPAELAETVGAPHLGAFGNYDLLEELGHGGMGVVYKARQRSLHRVVALKMLLGGQFAGKVALGRFRSEAELAAQLQHPNIVAIHDIGEHDGLPYFTMDFVAGRNLVDLVRDHPLSAQAAATYVQIIAKAIHYAHEQGVLHRDLKPSNILIDAFDQPRLTDFGLAKRLTGSSSDLTVSGQALGSPNFMPPEQAAGKHKTSGPTSDIYGLGAILYYLITARPPFIAENASAAVRQVLENEPVSPRVLNPAVPRDLETLCLKCLQKEPKQRYASAQAVADELGRFLRGEPIQARPASTATHALRWCRRKPQVAALALALVVLGTTGFVAVLTQWRRAETIMVQESRQHARADQTVHQLRLHQAAEYLANGRAAEGVALLASQLRRMPTNRALAEWVATELTHRSFPLPLAPALRHEKECTFAAFSPDGRFVLTVARDNAARVWAAETGAPLSAPMRHDPSVVKGDLVSTGSKPLEASFSPDGTLVATASVDGTARIWDAQTGTPRTPPLPHPDWVSAARFSPDGRQVATACRDGLVRLWDVRKGAPIGPVFRHAKWVNTVEFSPDGDRLLTAADDGVAQVWDTLTGAAVGKPLRHDDVVRMAAFSNDGQKVVTASGDGTARIWRAATGDPVGSPLKHGGRVDRAVFSPDGRWIATASADRTARLWDASTGSPASDALRHSGIVRWVEFSPEGQRLVTASEDRTVRVWSVATGEPILEPIHHRSTVWTARFSPDGRQLVTASADGAAQIWDALPGAIAVLTRPGLSRGLKIWWSPDGQRLLTVTRTARLWRANTMDGLATGFPDSDVRDGRFSPSGNLVAIAGGSSTARVRDGHTGEAVSLPMRHQDAVNSIEFSPDESRVATASDDGTACLWDARRGVLTLPPLRHPAAVRRATFSPNGRLLATACVDRDARLWDAATGSLVFSLSHQSEVQDVRFSPDGRRLLAVSTDFTVQVWEALTGQRCGPPLKHGGPVNQAMFAPDSRQVLTASQDWTVRIWDPDSGKLVVQPLQHEGAVIGMDLRADGRTLLTATRNGRLELWHDYRAFPLSTSLLMAQNLQHLVFSPDGFAVAVVGSDRIARVLRLPGPSSKVPEWFPALAEAIVGRSVSTEEELRFVAPEVLDELRRRVNALAPGQFSLASWWLADKTERPVDPTNGLTLEEYVARIIDQADTGADSTALLRQALCRSPTHGGLHAHYARTLLEIGATSAPAVLQEAEWYCARALQLSPENPEVWLAQAALSEFKGKTNDALLAMEKVKCFGAASPVFLLAAATLQDRAGRTELADVNYRQAISVALVRSNWSEWNRRGLMRHRADFLTRQGRRAEARVEELRALAVPPRDPASSDRSIRLDPHYNESLDASLDRQEAWWLNLSSLPKGRQILRELEFDLRGIVQLASSGSRATSTRAYPNRVEGIPIGQTCRRIHFLHATDGEVADGTIVALYRVHLQNGSTLELPVVYGKDVRAWGDETGPEPTVAHVAWQGRSRGTTRLRLFHSTWELPPRDQEVLSFDFVSKMTTSAAPFLVAVTLE